MKNKMCLLFLMIGIICMCIGCGKLNNDNEMVTTSIPDLIIETLEEKYPGKTLEVRGQDGLSYNVVDEEEIKFQVEPIQSTRFHFWCTDNYLDAYFQANGVD